MARLPFVQVDTDFITHGATALAAVLGPEVSTAQAGWAVLQLRTWALSRATDEATLGFIPGAHAAHLVATFAGWKGDPSAFLDALCDPAVGLAEVRQDGVQLLGLERDAAAVRKSRSDRERMSRRRRGDVDGKTQTQTQTQKEEPASQGEPPGPPSPEEQSAEQPEDVSGDAEPLDAEERPPLELVAQDAGPKPRRKSKAEELYDGFQENRRERCEARSLPFIDERWSAQRKNRDLGPIARLLPGSDARARFVAAWNEFLDDERMGQLNVPWSLGYFLQSLPQWEGKALKAAGGGA